MQLPEDERAELLDGSLDKLQAWLVELYQDHNPRHIIVEDIVTLSLDHPDSKTSKATSFLRFVSRTLYDSGMTAENIQVLERLTEIEPENMVNYGYILHSHLKIGQRPTAIEKGLRYIEDGKADQQTFGLVIRMLNYVKDHPKAITVYKMAAENYPGHRYFISQYVKTLTKMKHYGKAAAACEAAVTEFPNDEHLHTQLASLYVHTNQFGKAREQIALASERFQDAQTWQLLTDIQNRLKAKIAKSAASNLQQMTKRMNLAIKLTGIRERKRVG